jgi:hypothetical protein
MASFGALVSRFSTWQYGVSSFCFNVIVQREMPLSSITLGVGSETLI